MRQISLSLIVLAFIVSGCSKTPEPTVQEEVYIEEVTPAPAVAPVHRSEEVKKPAPLVKKTDNATYRRATVAPEEPMLIQEEEEIWVREPEDSGEIQKTYNELQQSQKKDDFPMYQEESSGRTFNESQISD